MNGFGMGVGMWIFWIVILLFVVFIIKILVDKSPDQFETRLESPLEILEKRYARGEINKDEFESMKKKLEK